MVSRKSPANIIISKGNGTKGILNISVNFENDSNLHVLKLDQCGMNIVNTNKALRLPLVWVRYFQRAGTTVPM